MTKCLYVATECMLEKRGKCGQSAKCPYAKKLLAAKGKGRAVDTHKDKKEVHQKPRKSSSKNINLVGSKEKNERY